MITRTLMAALTATVFALPMAQAQAQSRHDGPRHAPKYQPVKPGYNAPARQVNRPVVQQRRWVRGHRVADWRTRPHVRDYHRFGLHRPGPGQRWVRVDNSYLLVGIASGIIANVIIR